MRRAARTGRRGFTLIELMTVVAILGLLAAIVVPKLAAALRRSGEGAVKGRLGSLRSALSIYYADQEGHYPSELASLTIAGKYLESIPAAKVPYYHGSSDAAAGQTASDDAGGWVYSAAGLVEAVVWVNCTHTDTKGSAWAAY